MNLTDGNMEQQTNSDSVKMRTLYSKIDPIYERCDWQMDIMLCRVITHGIGHCCGRKNKYNTTNDGFVISL